MKLDKTLFDKIALEASGTPRLRKNFDLRDSVEENSQRMLNVLLPGSHVDTHRHIGSSEIVVCLQGEVIERFHDSKGNTTNEFLLKAGSDFAALWIPIGQYHSLDCQNKQSTIIEFKTGKYDPDGTEDFLEKDNKKL